jgi:hypothetical protein
VFQATRNKTTTSHAVSRGGQATCLGSSWAAHDTLPARLLTDRSISGPVAARDALVPLARRRDDISLQDVVMLFGLPLGRPDGGYCRPQLLVTGLPRSVRERSSERSRASALPAVLGHAWSHLKLVAAVQRTCFYLIFFIFCMYLKQIEGI